MPAINRLPAGYPAKVKKIKQKIREMYKELNDRQLSDQQIYNWIRYNCEITNYYDTKDKKAIHTDIDFTSNDITISYYIEIDNKTNKIKLGDSVVVWLNKQDSSGEEYWVDNYKW